jgi:hypothetical protein
VEFYKQIIQLIGQTSPATLAQVDLVEIFRRINTPLKSPDAMEQERARLATSVAAGGPPAITPQAGQLGVVRNPNANAGVTGGGSSPNPTTANSNNNAAVGFEQPPMIYVSGPDHIEFSDIDDFVANLPASGHYSDPTIRAVMLQLRRVWLSYYRNMYPDFAQHVESTKLDLGDLALSDEERSEGVLLTVMFANGNSKKDGARRITSKAAQKAATALLKAWQQDSDVLKELGEKSRKLLQKVLARQMQVDQRATGLKFDTDAKSADIDEFLDTQVGRLIKLTQGTVKDELRAFLANQIMEGRSSAEIADEIRAHFSGFEGHKADRVARSEIRDTVNAATLLGGESAKIRYVRASDGVNFDPTCANRDGKLMTIREAWREIRKEHPYGTLGFQLIPRFNFSIQNVNTMDDVLPPSFDDSATAFFDNKTDTVYLLFDQPQEDKDEFLSRVGRALVA